MTVKRRATGQSRDGRHPLRIDVESEEGQRLAAGVAPLVDEAEGLVDQHLPGPQNPRECHLYLAEGCHLYIALTTSTPHKIVFWKIDTFIE
jgi:hypothetical protein